MSHAGSRLLADAADPSTLTGELGLVLAVLRRPRTRHDPGRVLVEAVAVADGATTISDVAVLADQAALFAAAASLFGGRGVGLDVLAAAGPCWRVRAVH